MLSSDGYILGSNHAVTCVGLAYEMLRPDDPTIIAEARELAKSFIKWADPKGSVDAGAGL